MAIEEKFDFLFIGPNSNCVPSETIEFLGKLLASSVYGETDRTANMLLKLSSFHRKIVSEAAYKLYLLCDVVGIE